MVYRFELNESGDRADLRLGVGTRDGPKSALWRFWATNKGDVYVAPRPIAGKLKVSLHASGDWRLQYTRHFHDAVLSGTPWNQEERSQDQWTKPEDPPLGMTWALQIIVPATELRPLPLPTKKPTHWLSPAPEGKAAEIALVLQTHECRESLGLPDWKSDGYTALAQVDSVMEQKDHLLWIVGRHIDVEGDWRRRLEKAKQEARNTPSPLNEAEGNKSRIIVWGERANQGTRYFVDCAAD